MENIIIVIALILIIGLAALYIIKAKKSGKKCIGCPYSDGCSSKCECKHHTDTNQKDNTDKM